MSKIIDSLVEAEIESRDFVSVILAKFDWDVDTPHFGPLRCSNSYQSVYWDEAGAGEQEYIGLGNLAQVNTITETAELGSTVMQFNLSGIPNQRITNVLDKSAYQGKPCYLWYALLDKQTYAIQGGQTGPILVFAGLMDYCTFEFGETANIQLIATSRLTDWERSRGLRYNDQHQRGYIDSTDAAFKWVKALLQKEIRFGGSSILDPGGSNDYTAPLEDQYGPGNCFREDTLITLLNGKKVYARDIYVGDILKGSNQPQQVEDIHKYKYTGYLYSINDSDFFVTDAHPFKTPSGWKAFNVESAKELNPDLDITELNVSDILIKDNNQEEEIISINKEMFYDIDIFNFKVSGDRDYYANDYLVHNK